MAPKPSAAEEEQRRLNEIHAITVRQMEQDLASAKAFHDQKIAAKAANIQVNLDTTVANTTAMNTTKVAAVAAA